MTHLGLAAAIVVVLICLYALIMMAWKWGWKLNWPHWMNVALYILLGIMLGSFRHF